MSEAIKKSASGVVDNIDAEASSANDNSNPSAGNLEMVLDIPVTLSLEIGRTRMRISELMALSGGSVVELHKMVDEPLDVLVNGTLVAQGEAIVVDGKFGIRLTDVVSKQERLSKVG